MFSSENWFGASPSFYNGVAKQSLRFDIGSSTYLTRTPSSEGNRRTWVASFWVKRSDFNTSQSQNIFTSGVVNSTDLALFFDTNTTFGFYSREGGYVTTTRAFRDSSAWYHIVVALDTTQNTDSNRIKIYVNGTQETSLANSTYPAKDSQKSTNDDVLHRIGNRDYSSAYNYVGGYLAEFNLIDGLSFFSDTSGTANTSFNINSFGETKNGVWIPIKYTGSYGTNGFRLQFNQTGVGTASSSTIGADTSGNTHHFTSSGIVASDCNMPDSPENNFATWNPVAPDPTYSITTITEGSLKSQNTPNNNKYSEITFHLDETNKYYFEYYNITTTGALQPASFEIIASSTNKFTFYITTAGYIYVDGSLIGSGFPTLSAGDIVNIAFDGASGKLWLGKNGTYYNASGSATGNPADGTNPIATLTPAEFTMSSTFYQQGAIMNFGQDSTFAGNKTSGSENAQDSNGIGDFYDTVPSGFLALCSANLPEPTISPNADTQADDYFNTVIWSGTSSSNSRTDVGFQPDLVWLKNRSAGWSNSLSDSSRGTGKSLYSDAQSEEVTNDAYGYLSSFNSDGFTVVGGASGSNTVNVSGNTYVAWNWKAGGATPSKTYKVKVVSDSTDYGHGTGSNKYQFFKSDGSTGFGTNGVDLDLQEGGTYTFDWSDSSAQSHPLRFSLTNDGTHSSGTSAGSEYTTGVVKDDSAYTTTITVASGVANLYYYCQNHSGMGAEVRTNTLFGQTNFDAGSGSNISNGTANIATVQENQDAGFSIVTTTLTVRSTAVATIPHGLGSTPHFILAKQYDTANIWSIYHQDIPSNSLMLGGSYGDDAMNSNSNFSSVGGTTFGHQTNSISNNANENHIFYCFKEIAGHSRFGSYVGNGATSGTAGTFVYLGFRPSFVMLKSTSTGSWWILDSTRDPFNEALRALQANDPAGESAYSGNFLDFYSNGFAPRTSGTQVNGSGTKYIYMAFAEVPFKYALGR